MSLDISTIQQIQEVIQKKPNLICLSIGATYLQEKYPSEARGTNDIDFVVFHKKNIRDSKLELMIVEQLQSINCQRYTESNNPLRFKTNLGVNTHIYVRTIGDFEISATIKERASTNHSLAIEDYVFVNYHQLLQGASYEFAEPLVNKMRGNFRFTIDCVS